MKTLIIALHDNQKLFIQNLNVVISANQLGFDCDILVIGSNCSEVVNSASKIDGVNKVLSVDSEFYENQLSENTSKLIADIAKDYSHIMVASTTFGKNIMPCVAAHLDCAQLTDVIEIISEDTFKRPIYAGNAIATVQSFDEKKLLTIRTTAFEKAKITDNQCDIVNLTDVELTKNEQTKFVNLESDKSEKADLATARVVISGGRGLASAENFKLLENIADKIDDCAIGASRAAVDAGYVPNELQVGQTGKVVAPELYIAVGISGAIQHWAGMKDSKVIVAINKDENAPIFSFSDYGLVADLFDVLPELEKLLEKK